VTRTSLLTPSQTTADIQRADLPRQFLTLSNILSILRVLLCIPFVLIMFSQMSSARIWGAVVMVIAALTDKLDGVLARKLHQTSEWGKILDPLADKIAVATVGLVLLGLELLPLWFVCIAIARDTLILLGGVYVKAQYGILLPSNEIGKWTVGIVSLLLFLLVIDVQGILPDLFLAASTFLLVASFGLYVRRFIAIVQDSQGG